jgi:hypothetical protein
VIALVDEFVSLGAPVQTEEPGVVVALLTIPPEAVEAFRALIAVSHTVARVERIALNAITRGKSPRRVLPLLEKHAALRQTQAELVHTVAVLLHGAQIAAVNGEIEP